MNINREIDFPINIYEKCVISSNPYKPVMLTPFIVTFCLIPGEKNLTSVDIRRFIEVGLKIVRFKMSHLTRSDKIMMLEMIKDATEWYCKNNDLAYLPITIALDLPSAIIRTGFLKTEINQNIDLAEGAYVKLTADPTLWHACDWETIYIDDPYTIKNIPIGTEISISLGEIVMTVTDVIDHQTIRCKVLRGGTMANLEFVCIRGVKHTKPPISDMDLELIELAIDYKLDIVIINAIQKADVFRRIRKIFRDSGVRPPLLMGTICEEEGLNNIDDIIKGADGIILAREFLAHQIVNEQKMITIQMYLSGKCKAGGIPFYISGNVLERTLLTGTISGSDLDDITNGVLQHAGFVLTNYKNPDHVIEALKHMEEMCKVVEPITHKLNDIWRLSEETRLPATTADSCVIACALLAKVSGSVAIIVNSVSGKTAIGVSQMTPSSIIITVTRSLSVARRLQIHRAVIPVIYDRTSKSDWTEEMGDRVMFAVEYGLEFELLKAGDRYVAFTKSLPTSAYNDNLSTWTVLEAPSKKNMRPDFESVMQLASEESDD